MHRRLILDKNSPKTGPIFSSTLVTAAALTRHGGSVLVPRRAEAVHGVGLKVGYGSAAVAVVGASELARRARLVVGDRRLVDGVEADGLLRLAAAVVVGVAA